MLSPRCAHGPARNPSPVWLVLVLLGSSATQIRCRDAPAVPRELRLSADTALQRLSVSWLGGEDETFDLLILRTELNETVFYETVRAEQEDGRRHWAWTSQEPLECTSLSVRLRSRDGQTVSEWSDTQILPGMDLPTNKRSSMFPQDLVVAVGANTTFCCILEERRLLGGIRYSKTVMNTTRLSRRSYAITRTNQAPSSITGTNVFCSSQHNLLLTGTVVFVGYRPSPRELVCETRDLVSVVCQWNSGRDTHLYGTKRQTYYTLNGRNCTEANMIQQRKESYTCSWAEWEGNWTLVARNPLGQRSLNDSAELRRRVRLVAPGGLTSVNHAWNATLLWDWNYESYGLLALICQVETTSFWHKTTRTFHGVGLHSAVLLDLFPDEVYSVRIRCGTQQNFWKWGDWSNSVQFRTSTDIPETPDVWVTMDTDNTGRVMWKPLKRRQSHGQITGFALTLFSPEENVQRTESLPHYTFAAPFNLSQAAPGGRVTLSVMASNAAGTSPPASVVLPLRGPDVDPSAVSRALFVDGAFPLSWESDSNASCGYVLEWREACCLQDCSVDWTKVAAGNTNASIQSGDFQMGVRYTFSLYSCSSDAPELRRRWQGYTQELVPSSSAPHFVSTQQDSDVQLSWEEIPLVNQRGFLLGFRVYINIGSQLKLLATLPDPNSRNYTVTGLPISSYKFTVKAYTSAGEDTGATASITMASYSDWLLLEILSSLGALACFLILVTFICYKKRKWVKKAFYPEIPEPKLAGGWSRVQGPLDVSPSSSSMVHILEEPHWDSSKEALVVIPEEEEDEDEGIIDEPVDTDEPTSIRYYNQVVDERPIRPRFPDSSTSSASSLDSARTDVTYTGIQTSGSSLAFQTEPQFSPDEHQPPVGCEGGGGGGGGYQPQMQTGAEVPCPGQMAPRSFPEPQPPSGGSFGGYQPQSSWHLDSPGEGEASGDVAPCLGSPTSVASTQFLLPDGGSQEHTEGKGGASSSSTTWFQNLLSSSKP